MDSHTISTLNRLEVVDTGRRRRWSEGEKARVVLESLSEPRLAERAAVMATLILNGASQRHRPKSLACRRSCAHR
jgi:hypothetical protein